MDTKTRLFSIIAETFSIEPGSVTWSTSQDTVEKWDSFGMVTLVSELELAFGVQFELLEMAEIRTVGIIRILLNEKGIDV